MSARGALASGRARNEGLTRRIEERARQLGFHALAFGRADQPLGEDFARYQSFVAHGMHGGMSYLAKRPELRRRLDAPAILDGAKTVICLAWCYGRGARAELGDSVLARHIARYARGRDYHRHVRGRLNRLAAFVRGLDEGVQARALCDTAPVLERAWAARAGLGFVGKNGLLIVPGLGSYTVLGEVVTTLALPATAPVEPLQCGSCVRCLEACPAGALVQPYVVDARRCLSYLTVELRGPVPDGLRPHAAERLFGCDGCQQVCPHNEVPPPPGVDCGPFQPLQRWSEVGWTELVCLDKGGWRALTSGSALRRVGRAGLARNAVLVAWRRCRRGDQAARAVLEAALRHDESSVRELARWALEQADT